MGPRHMPLTPAQFDTLERVTDRVRGMLHQFAAGIYPDEAPLEAGALQDLMSVVRAHSALHDDAHAGSALHLVQVDASSDRGGDWSQVRSRSSSRRLPSPMTMRPRPQKPAPTRDRHRAELDRRRWTRHLPSAGPSQRNDIGLRRRDRVRSAEARSRTTRRRAVCATSSTPNCWKYS